jgi:LPS-assembly protein
LRLLFLGTAGLLVTGPCPVLADTIPPPIGYVGPWPPPASANSAPTTTATVTRPSPSISTTTPPIGYVGPWPPPASANSAPITTATVTRPSPLISTTTTPPNAAAAPTIAKHPSPNAAATDSKDETLVTAQQMSSDQNTGIITATGRVEISRAGYILHADKVTYNRNTGVMRAEGHVAVLAPSGEVEFADAEEVTGDMKQAFAENIGILFPDNSRMVARTAQRYDGRYTVADMGMYTSCNVCKRDPNNPPLWQIRAKQIVHDNTEHDLYYHDATIDFAGTPVFYTPYFSTPDPTVERRQGFLTATPGFTPDLGAFVKVPYYFDIAPESDAILAPTFSQTDGVQMGGEFRRRFANGNMQFDGSFTHAKLINDTGIDEGQQWRGHLFGTFLYNINNIWRAGTDVAFTSDKSYLQRYRITSADQLTNRAYVEGFEGRNYTVVNSYVFEDLRAGSQPAEPFVFPQAGFSLLGEPGQTLGGRWSLNGSTLATMRDNGGLQINQQGPDTRRISLNAGWDRRLVSDTGLVTNLNGFVRGDSYWADNVIDADTGQVSNNVLLARQFEQASATMSYPIGRNGDGYQQLVEPIVSLVGAPGIRNDPRTPIEDSVDIQFDETNLFAPNRFTGNDLIEGGSRATYGLRHAITTDGGGRVDMFGGQSYDFSKNNQFPGLSGLRDQSSDYVGRIEFVPTSWLDLNYGARLDHSTLAPQRQDARVSFGTPVFRPYMRYISAQQTQTTGVLANVEEAIIGADAHFAKYWYLHGEHTQAFSPQPGPRTSIISASYMDECFILGVTVSHNDTNRADISSGTSAVFHILLKNLGGIKSDSFTGTNFPAEFRQTEP